MKINHLGIAHKGNIKAARGGIGNAGSKYLGEVERAETAASQAKRATEVYKQLPGCSWRRAPAEQKHYIRLAIVERSLKSVRNRILFLKLNISDVDMSAAAKHRLAVDKEEAVKLKSRGALVFSEISADIIAKEIAKLRARAAGVCLPKRAGICEEISLFPLH